MKFRNYIYFDRKKVEQYLSSLEEGIVKQKQVSTERKKPNIQGKVDMKIASISVDKGYEIHSLQEIKELPDTSLFERLEELLKQEEGLVTRLNSTSKLNLNEILSDFKRGDLIYVSGQFKLSKFDHLMNYINSMLPSLKGRVSSFEKNSKMIENFLSSKISINIEISQLKTLAIISRLNKELLECPIEDLTADYELFGRIRRVLKKNEKIRLYNIEGGINLPESAIAKFIKTFSDNPAAASLLGISSTLSKDDLDVKYPAIEIDPVVIYW